MWFTVNSLKPNQGKFQYMILGKYVTSWYLLVRKLGETNFKKVLNKIKMKGNERLLLLASFTVKFYLKKSNFHKK